MPHELLKRIGIPPSTDYARAFAALARWAQPGRDFLARRKRGAAAMRVGDYHTSLEDARWCVLQRPDDVDACRLQGLAALGAAAVRLLDLPVVGAGSDGVDQDPAVLLVEARNSFGRVLEQGSDHVARIGLQACQELESMAVRPVVAKA